MAFLRTMDTLLGPDDLGSFPTLKILDEMNAHGRRPQPAIWDRLNKKEESHVNLARLDKSRAQEKQTECQKQPPETAWVQLKCSLTTPDLSPEQLERLGSTLCHAFDAANVPLRGINWGDSEFNIDPKHPRSRWLAVTGEVVRLRNSTISSTDTSGDRSPHGHQSSTSSTMTAPEAVPVQAQIKWMLESELAQTPDTSDGSVTSSESESGEM